jgi:hypothetical protein
MKPRDDIYNFDQEREVLEDHSLEIHVDTPTLKAWYLRSKPSRRLGSSLILSTVEGLIITGDLCPGQNGVCSTYGYGADWFAGRLSPNYLCEKFLQREFVPALAERHLRERIVALRREGSIEKADARDAWNAIHDDLSPDEAYAIERDIGDEAEGLGYGYNPSERRWLCAIQERFASLYHAQVKAAA